LALRLMGTIKTAAPAMAGPASLPAGEGAPQGISGPPNQNLAAESTPPSIPRPTGPRLELSDPDITAKVVRAWMNDEGAKA